MQDTARHDPRSPRRIPDAPCKLSRTVSSGMVRYVIGPRMPDSLHGGALPVVVLFGQHGPHMQPVAYQCARLECVPPSLRQATTWIFPSFPPTFLSSFSPSPLSLFLSISISFFLSRFFLLCFFFYLSLFFFLFPLLFFLSLFLIISFFAFLFYSFSSSTGPIFLFRSLTPLVYRASTSRNERKGGSVDVSYAI